MKAIFKPLYTPWLKTILLAISAALMINQFGLALSIVNGTSMEPTLEDGDRLLINKFYFMFDDPKRGDVVTFEDPNRKGKYLVKRVVGIPGDRIEIKGGDLYRNGKYVYEPYVNTDVEDGDFGPIIVEEGKIFVMGDNRHRYASRDSRYPSVGQIPCELVEGKVEWIIWRPSLTNFL
ncbi:signal peptidase I [Melghirimyces algeriensis]|uniref:Signal peptidase I n=1 Tax=Melghirimyces algeriensis TaxID=910412 RepID=A0A521DWF3_9BACL|nr:signal peptidase I [Melghirimyces algeriensis]SMO76037.1 signal peptidase I [Melghirimyces algeriensis]